MQYHACNVKLAEQIDVTGNQDKGKVRPSIYLSVSHIGLTNFLDFTNVIAVKWHHM